ncbi:hypothetical protein ACG02S_13575 [Roseateles sp. DC23W]|uniref:Uncharacterized protein n=1 Tax=Pelomonas dachongensis TaxID=3299029 RepID=A0ABW7EPY9_9BURK
MAAAPAATELCGLGRLPLQATGGTVDSFDQLPAPLGRLALLELQERLQHALAAGDARQRVAAWLLRQPEAPEASAQAAWAAGLLAEAHAGGEALALRWAASACGHTDDPAACRHALAVQRLHAEPGNGLHQLAVAPTWPQAWRHLTRASHWREHPGGLTATVQAALDTLQPPPAAYLRARLARETLARDASMAPEGLELLEAPCAAQPASCAEVAERMAASADSATLLQQAAALGRLAGWPDARVEALTTTTQAFHAQLPRWADEPQAALGCAAAEPALAHARAVAQQGEVRPTAASRP